MGFGTLFIGYLIGLNTVAYPGFTKILSYLVMLMAATKLARFNRHLKGAYYALIPTCLVGVCHLFVEAGALFSLFAEDTESLLVGIVSPIAAILELVFMMRLLRGLQELAVETEVKVLEIAAFRNRIFTLVYYALYILGLLFLNGAENGKLFAYCAIVILLLGLAVTLLNAKLFYNFYMWICLPEDLAMERKPSRFPLLERIHKYFDGVEERQLARRRERNAEQRHEHQRKDKSKKK